MSSSPVFAVDASTGGKVRLLATSNKLHVRASELETKLDTLNTTCSNINVSVGDVDVNTDSLESLQTAGNASVASLDGKITACDTSAVAVSSSALPSGAATSANQDVIYATLGSLEGKITACDTMNVEITSCVLPSGAATSATQDAMYANMATLATSATQDAMYANMATSANQTSGNQSLADILIELQTPTSLASESTVQDIDSSVQSLITPLDDLLMEVQNNGSKLDNIVSNTASTLERSVSNLASGVSVADGVDIGAASSLENIDMSSHKTLVISGSSSVSGSIEMYVSNDGGTTYFFAESLWSMSNYSGSVNTWYKVIENSPEMVKFKWVGGSTSTISFDVCKQNW